MPTRTESSVLCSQEVDPRPARAFLERINQGRPRQRRVTFFHLLLVSLATALHERPRLNRFVAGGRYYQRHGVWIAFSGKQGMDNDAPLFVRKRQFKADESLDEAVDGILGLVGGGRSGEKTTSDREVGLLLKLPPLALRLAMRVVRALNAVNLIPAAMVESDPLFASAFVANLGSVGIDACYHHNYEYGTIPIFATLGRSKNVAVVTATGQVEAGEVLEIKYTYDERVADGFYCASALERVKELLEHPELLKA
ncbi:MAG: 2-oxo acid dehydrogenase subunit E2 [Deltaproteobacteria bacterium]